MNSEGNPDIEIGQEWFDMDPRNWSEENVDGWNRGRRVEIVTLPTRSRKGTMRVIEAPRNPKSVGQLREYTAGKLHTHYALMKEAGHGTTDQP